MAGSTNPEQTTPTMMLQEGTTTRPATGLVPITPRQHDRQKGRSYLPQSRTNPELDAILISPANDAEFEILWQRMMHTTPGPPDLFPSPPHRRPNPAATGTPERSVRNIAPGSLGTQHRSGCRRSLPVLPGTPPPAPKRAKPVTAIRASPPDLVQRAKLAKRTPAPSTTRVVRHPVIGVGVQRSSATNARKLAALLAEPPPVPRRAGRPATETRQERARRQLTALFGDLLFDLDGEPQPPFRLRTTRGKPAHAARTRPPRHGKRQPQHQHQRSPRPGSPATHQQPQPNQQLQRRPHRQPSGPPVRQLQPPPRPATDQTDRPYPCAYETI
ncbi:serine/arginine repetitive matrix protein 1-like [Solenopsis invicta]|uniref:serine/arginine repetitive matrix protein 1-like n=1 Tax=Solenopsis invicta TaxID=13686 RepID=UPI00193DA4EF|nr:serine/arginine repetitive matrix protein 1-like [Solenopsis invicta]